MRAHRHITSKHYAFSDGLVKVIAATLENINYVRPFVCAREDRQRKTCEKIVASDT